MTPVVFHSCDATLLSQLPERRVDSREYRCLSELRKNSPRLGQMLNSEGTLFLGFVKQAEYHFPVGHMVPRWIEMRIFQDARH